MDLKRYWNSVREIEAGLPGPTDEPVYLVSIDNEITGTTAGKVSANARHYAARWIATGTHKLASPEQIEAYHAEVKSRTAAIVKFELEKKQTVRLETAIPPEQLQEAIAAALADHATKPARSPRG